MRDELEKIWRDNARRAARREKQKREREMFEMAGLIRYMYQGQEIPDHKEKEVSYPKGNS